MTTASPSQAAPGAATVTTAHAQDERGQEAADRSGDRLAVDVAHAPDANPLLAEEGPEDLGARIGRDVRAPDHRKDGREFLFREHHGELRADGHHHELEHASTTS